MNAIWIYLVGWCQRGVHSKDGWWFLAIDSFAGIIYDDSTHTHIRNHDFWIISYISDVYRGRWHGDVILHQFKLQSSEEVGSFWSEVQSLSKLRHENLLLFMGIATMDDEGNDSVAAEHNKESLNCYTIVNSAPRGVSVANFRLGSVKNGKPERIGYI